MKQISDLYLHNLLIVSSSDKGKYYIKNLLLESHHTYFFKMCSSANEARRELLNNDYELVIINAPLLDDEGDHLAISIKEETSSEVLLIVKTDQYDSFSFMMDQGVFTIPKPVNKSFFYQLVSAALIVVNKKKTLQKEIVQLKQKMEEMRLIHKAKCLLVEKCSLSEAEAHKMIEKTAMDTRDKKVTIAMRIIKKYNS